MTDARNAFFAWRGMVLKRRSTLLEPETDLLLAEAWAAAYDRGRKDGFSLSARLRGAVDVLSETIALLERWDLEREAIDLVGAEVVEPDIDDEPPPDVGPHVGAVIREWDDDREPIQPGDYHYYNAR